MASTAKKINWYPEERAAWRPPERLSISEWSEKYRILVEPAEEKGPLRLRRTPYVAPIMDMLQDPHTETVVFCKAAQIAGSEAMISIIGYYLHQEASPTMLILADEDTAIYMMRERIQRMFYSSPSMRRLVSQDAVTRNELTLKNGAYFSTGWASSVAKLASRPMRIMVLDEIDKPGYYLTTKEASPISLAIERTETFYGRKIAMLSTPTIEDGNVWQQLKSCDVIYDWHVPCPACGQFQPLRWSPEHTACFPDGTYLAADGEIHKLGRVKWDGGRDATPEQIQAACYECGECKATWSTIEKNISVERGKMVSRTVIDYPPRKIGFHVNRLYSLLGKSGDLAKLVDDWIRTVKSKDAKLIQGFYNSTLAEPFIPYSQERKEGLIYNLRDSRQRGDVPADGVLGITGGADTQDDGFYYVVRAWGAAGESWLIREGFTDSWDVLMSILSGTYRDGAGLTYVVNFSLQDAMGHRTAEVYERLKFSGFAIAPSKGMQAAKSPYFTSMLDKYPGTNKPIPGGLKLYNLNVTHYKDKLNAKMHQQPGEPGTYWVHSEISDLYAQHLCAEYRNDKGVWECPRGKENHWFDCEVLALAAADILGVAYWQREKSVQRQPAPQRRVHSRGIS